ncbi:MAG: TrpB-like pyridoxal-phosphate dependent enzyme [Comamonadaceae bacterium]|nr:TrpB-like pyridoxal-phosphate dependent enzyme [Comamonadaceae bacterium]
MPQAWYNAQAGIKKLATETGAGQWGSSLAFAGALFGHRGHGLPGARVVRPEAVPPRADGDLRRDLHRQSPSNETNCRPRDPGRSTRTTRARWASRSARRSRSRRTHDDTKYALGSVLNHVLMHQTIIGQEAMLQLEMAGDDPDVDRRLHRRRQQLRRHRVPVHRPAAARRRSKRAHRRRRAGRLPEPDARQVRLRLRRHRAPDAADQDAHAGQHLHAAGLPRRRPALPRHGAAGVSHLKELGLIEATAYHQNDCFEAGVLFARAEGIVPAPEANHAVKGAIVEALRCKAEGKAARRSCSTSAATATSTWRAYSDYLAGKLVDQPYDEAELAMALAGLPSMPA